MRTWGTIPYSDVLAERLLAAWAAWSRGAAGAGATARDSSRCRSSKYGSSSLVKKEYAMPDRPALSTQLSQVQHPTGVHPGMTCGPHPQRITDWQPTSTGSTACSVNEKLRLCWKVVVDNIVEKGQVDAARSYVSDDQDASYARPELATVDTPCCLHALKISRSLCLFLAGCSCTF